MMQIINPANGTLIETVLTDNDKSINQKVTSAKEAQKAWKQTPFQSRAQAMINFQTLLKDNQDSLAKLLTSEMGKPITQASAEIAGTIRNIDFFVKSTNDVLQDDNVWENEIISYEPLGAIANISAWNYPYFVSTNVIVPALLTGNAVLFKPSEYSTLSGLRMVSLMHDAGIPKDILMPIVGAGDVGGKLLESPINGIFFTGSCATGMRISQAVAGKLIKLQLELGGKDAGYVCNDADITHAAASLCDGSFYNAGQSCCGIERIYVHHDVYDSFVEKFVNNAQNLKIGDPMDEGTYLGPLTRKVQMEFLNGQLDDALNKGAQILHQGSIPSGSNGNFFPITVVGNVNHEMSLMRDESFGPIVGIQKVSGDEEAIKLMNNTEYGLTSSVYSNDESKAKRILSQLDTGTAYWNCCDRVSSRLPWSGRKHSGLGSTLSKIGIQAFLRPKAWHLKNLG